MKQILAIIIVLLAFSAEAQRKYPNQQGLGLRIGAPTGLTYKKYVSKWNALEFTVGTVPLGWNRTYYQNQFNAWSRYDSYIYLAHNVESAVYFQGRYLMHFNVPIEDMTGRLNWYWGLGGMAKIAKVQYTYADIESNPTTQVADVTDIDVGPEGIVGAEYTFEDVPVALFAETSLMIELADRPGAARMIGGFGVRYNFH
jgi:hypothetical protein